MTFAWQHLRQHLEHAAQAYGPDLVPPPVPTAPRPFPAATPPQVLRPDPEDAVARTAAPAPPQVPAGGTPPSPAAAVEHPAAAASNAALALQTLRAEVMPCTRCKLHAGRQHVVFGEGNPNPRVLFIGEAPGAVEDRTGRPFVGPAGQLLDRILAGAMGLQRGDVYIANINKCRPPGNREPEPDEVAACLPYLRRQVEILRPEVIVCLGRIAAQNLLGSSESTRALRGRIHDYHGVRVVVTWHPAYLLRDPSHKRETWEDIKQVNRLLGLPEVPTASGGSAGTDPGTLSTQP